MLQLRQDKLDILRIHISIRVLLTPGTTTPIDIKNPDKITQMKENTKSLARPNSTIDICKISMDLIKEL